MWSLTKYFLSILVFSKVVKSDDTQSFKVCKKCSCQWDKITPLIDCVGRNLTETEVFNSNWSFEGSEKSKNIKEITVDLDLASNPNIQVIKSLPDLPVEKLSFKNCNVSSIEKRAFNKLVYISYLDLSNNDIAALDKDIFEGPHRYRRSGIILRA